MGERTHWTDAEWDRIVQLATPVILANPGKTIISCVQQIADQAITPDRMRKLPNIGAIRADIRQKLEALRKSGEDHPEVQLLKEQFKTHQTLLDEANARIKELIEQNTALQGKIQLLELNKPPTEREVIVGFFGEILGKALAIKEEQNHPKVQMLPDPPVQAPKPPKHDPEPAPSNGIRKPKVVIVGGFPNLHHELQREFGNDLELRFFHGSAEQSRLGDNLRAYKDRSHGKVLLWADRVGHSAEAALKFQNIPYDVVRGQISAIREKLRKIISGGGPAR